MDPKIVTKGRREGGVLKIGGGLFGLGKALRVRGRVRMTTMFPT